MHLTSQDLADWIDDRASSELRARIAGHLAEPCAQCQAQLDAMTAVIESMRTDTAPEPPAHVLRAAIGLFRREPLGERVRAWLGDLTAEIGRLVSDSAVIGGSLAPAGVRGVAAERRMRYESSGFELDLLVERHGSSSRLIGQVLELGDSVRPVAGCRYLVAVAGVSAGEGTADALGEFTVDVPGTTDLTVYVACRERSASFEVSQPSPPGRA